MENKDIKPITEKLDEKIKKLNSSRVFKKITPKGDLSWYVKWISVLFIVTGWCLTSITISLQYVFPIDRCCWMALGRFFMARQITYCA